MMTPRLRLLPVVAIVAIAVLGWRLGSFVSFEPRSAAAAEKGETPAKPAVAAEAGRTTPASGADAKAAESSESAAGGPQKLVGDPLNFTPQEIELLQDLARRRDAMDAREREIELREAVLKTTELKLKEKVSELEELKRKIESLVKSYSEQEQAKLKSLVKIYESMKPKEAARIFEALEMTILLEVIDAMRENKSAPILAAMSPEVAKRVTEELAVRRQLPGAAKAAKAKSPSEFMQN
jgi:flagellar motility protein MotE (MotC chaperone)